MGTRQILITDSPGIFFKGDNPCYVFYIQRPIFSIQNREKIGGA